MVLLVIADAAAPFLKELSRLPQDVRVVVGNHLQDVIDTAPEADAILYADTESEVLMQVLPLAGRLRWIHCLWTGVDWILKPELLNHPAPLTNGRGVFRWPLADWVVASMLFFAFDLRRIIRQQEQSLWKPFVASSLRGRTLGIVGYGSIGSAIAERARPFGMTIAALRRRPQSSPGDSFVDRNYAPAQLGELMAESDYVAVAAPLTADTRGLIGKAELAAMKPTGVIINVGRGPVIDEPELIRTLAAGAIRGAALDVFTAEPLSADHPFWRMPNVLLSPHTADRIEGFLNPAWECFFENFERFGKGLPLANIVDKRAGY